MTLWEGILCFVTGTAVGTVYFGGLWHTVRLLKTTKRATRVLLVSWLLRNLFFVFAFFYHDAKQRSAFDRGIFRDDGRTDRYVGLYEA